MFDIDFIKSQNRTIRKDLDGLKAYYQMVKRG
jgi:hypothetical protein